MSREKQIDEMARIIDDNHGFIVSSVETAKALYNAGYRKQSEMEQLVNEIFDEVEKCVIGTIEPSFIQLRDRYIAKMKGGDKE